MHVVETKNSSGKPMYFLLNSDGEVIEPVYKFIIHLARCGNSKHTLKNYTHRLKIFFEWLELMNLTYLDIANGRDKTHKASVEYLADFIMWLKYPAYNPKIVSINKEPLVQERSNYTINLIMSTIYSFYDYLAFVYGGKKLNVFKATFNNRQKNSVLSEMILYREAGKKPILKQTVEEKTPKFITRKEYESIYKACTCRRDRIICGLMFEGGCRVSEVVGLHYEDLKHLSDNRIDITFREDVNNPDAAVKYRSEGSIYIPQYLVDEIVLFINENVDIDTNYLIFNLYGDTKYQAMRTDTIRDMIERTAKRAGIQRKITPHMFRHGIAVELYSLIAKEGIDSTSPIYGMQMVDIKDKLRHKSITSTNIYANALEEAKKESAAKYYARIDEDFTEEDLDDIADSLMIRRNDDECD